MTYVLYKNSNVAWQGSKPNRALNEKLGLSLNPRAFQQATPEELDTFQIYRLIEAPRVAGKIVTVTNHQKQGFEVHETYTEEDDPNYVAPDPVAELTASLVASIKREAGRRIIEIIPEWKQRNLTAQAAQLAEKGRDNWTVEETADWNAGQAVWFEVSNIREKSDLLEQGLESMTLEELRVFNPLDDEVWG